MQSQLKWRPAKQTALSRQWRKMTKGSAAVLVVGPAVTSQISTDYILNVVMQCGAAVGGMAANDDTFWPRHVSPARSAPAG